MTGKYREGEARGELKRAKAVARKMLAKKAPLKEILELTELSLAEITELMNSDDQ